MSRWHTGVLLLALMSGLPGCTVYPEREAKAFSDATGGESVERAYWRAVAKKDWKSLDAQIAQNFVYVTPSGRLERAAALEQIHALRVSDYSLGDLTTEMSGATFVVSYALTLKGTADGKTLAGVPERRVSVWQKQKASWVLISQSVLGPAN